MNSKKKIKLLTAFAIIFCILYFFLAYKKLGTELNLTPEWTEKIFHTTDVPSDEELIPFRLGQNLGYFTKSGKIVNSITFPSKAAISSSYWSTYSEANTEAAFYKPDGTSCGILKFPGFPFFDEDRIFVFLPGGSSFLRSDSNGNKLWQYEYYAPVTAFSSSKNAAAAGFADGAIVTFKADGSVDQEFFPGGSNLPVILGVAVSKDGNMTACVSGLDKQRFVLAKKDNSHCKIIIHEYIENEQSKQLLVKFNSDDSLVFYDSGNSLGIIDINKLQSSKIPVEGSIIQIEELGNGRMYFVLSRKNKTYTVTVLEPFDQKLGEFSYEADSSFIQLRDNNLFIGKNDEISCLVISRK